MRVAVIGAGAAGLVCARELVRKRHDVTVYEQSPEIGGAWVYTAEAEDDPLGRAPSHRVFSSMYDSLRTNLPRDLMAFRDYTFDSDGGGEDDWERFPHHTKVLAYLQSFARDFGIAGLVRCNETVTALHPTNTGKWRVQTDATASTQYDAVAVCNGHYARPRVPDIPDMDRFKGKLLHSHNYRNAERFRGKCVALLGTAASGADLSREIAVVADHVYWCGETFTKEHRIADNITGCPTPIQFHDHGIEFSDGAVVERLDAFIFCTGYEYEFPFLGAEIVSVTDNWVHPLYLDIVSPDHPTLGFIGLPFVVIPFPLFEMQAKWFAAVISGDVQLPDQDRMRHMLDAHTRELEQRGAPTHHYHKLGDDQFAYTNLLAEQCGADPVPQWFLELASETAQSRLDNPERFRDLPLQTQAPSVVTLPTETED